MTLEKRKVSLLPEEARQLDLMADQQGISVSELLVKSTLAPERAARRSLTPAETKALAAELMPLRNTLSELVVAVKDDESTEALDAFMVTAKKTTDRIYDAIESLVQ